MQWEEQLPEALWPQRSPGEGIWGCPPCYPHHLWTGGGREGPGKALMGRKEECFSSSYPQSSLLLILAFTPCLYHPQDNPPCFVSMFW